MNCIVHKTVFANKIKTNDMQHDAEIHYIIIFYF
jgi:hypothetical protein